MAKILTGSLLLASLAAGMYKDDGSAGASGSGSAPAEAVKVPEGMKLQTFHFRKEKIVDPEDKTKVLEVFKHPSVNLPLPIPTREQVLEIFNSTERTTEQKYILDIIFDQFYSQAREQINAFREDKPTKEAIVTADVLDYSKISINALANMPASERGSKVSDEDMAAFIQDYVAIMPAASNKDAAKVKVQADLLEKGLRPVKTDKKVLAVMQQLLQVWVSATENLEEHQEVYDMLAGRITKWLAAEPKNVLDSIM